MKTIGHFPIPPSLYVKVNISVKCFGCYFSFLLELELISITKILTRFEREIEGNSEVAYSVTLKFRSLGAYLS